jgi:hypothetical protein
MLTIKNALLRVHVDGTHVLSAWRNGDFIVLNHTRQTIGLYRRSVLFLEELDSQWAPFMEDAWRKASNGTKLATLSFGVNEELVRIDIYVADDPNYYHRIAITFRDQDEPFYTCYCDGLTLSDLFPKAYQVADVGRGWSYYCSACDYVWSPAFQVNPNYSCPHCGAVESLQSKATLEDLAAYYREADALEETEAVTKECQPW